MIRKLARKTHWPSAAIGIGMGKGQDNIRKLRESIWKECVSSIDVYPDECTPIFNWCILGWSQTSIGQWGDMDALVLCRYSVSRLSLHVFNDPTLKAEPSFQNVEFRYMYQTEPRETMCLPTHPFLALPFPIQLLCFSLALRIVRVKITKIPRGEQR